MRKLLSAVLCLLGTSLVCSAFGATVTNLATFNGFTNRVTQGSYTVNLNGNTNNLDGTVTIASKPIILTGPAWSAGQGSTTGTLTDNEGLSVVVKYTGRPTTSANAAILTTSLSSQSSYASAWGCYVNSSFAVKGIWTGSAWSSDTGTSTGTITESGYVVFTCYYDSKIGTQVYCVTPDSTEDSGYTVTNVYAATGLRGSNNVGATLCIGGTYAGNLLATGMTVEGVAVYQGCFADSSAALAAVQDYETYVTNDVPVVLSGNTTSVSEINAAFTALAAEEGATTDPTNRAVIASSDLTITNDTSLTYNVYIETSGAVHFVPADGVEASDTTTASNNIITNFDFSRVSGGVYYDYWASTIATATYDPHYTMGAGNETSGATVTMSTSGSMDLTGGTYYFPNGSFNGTAATNTVTVGDDAIICLPSNATDANARFCIGNATYTFTGNAQLNTTRFLTGVSTQGCSANLTITDEAAVTVTGRGESYGTVDSGDADIILGNLGNTTTVFTQSGNATFTATSSEILVGKQGGTHTLNIEGGTMTVLGIRAATNATSNSSLNLSGGTLNLGASGIDRNSTSTLPVSVTGDATIGGTDLANNIPITQAVTVSDGATLTFSNAVESATTDTTIDMTSGTLTCNGSLAVLDYVNLKVADFSMDGEVTGSGTITVSGTASLEGIANTTKVVLSGESAALTTTLAASGNVTASDSAQTITVVLTDEEKLSDQTFELTTGSTATVTVVDSEGNALVSSTDGTTTTYSVSSNYKTITLTSDSSSVNWNDTGVWMKAGTATTAPAADEPAFIILDGTDSGTVTLTAAGTATNLTVKGTGTVTISGAENLTLVTTESITVAEGTTLEYNVASGSTVEIPMITGGGTFVKKGEGTVFRHTTSSAPNVAESVTIQPEEGTFRIGFNDNTVGSDPILDNVTLNFVNDTGVFAGYGWARVVGTLNVVMTEGVTNGISAVESKLLPAIAQSTTDTSATMTISGAGAFEAPIDLPTTVESGSTLSLTTGSSLTTFTEVISGAGSLYVPDSGTVTNTISVANTFTGGITVDGIVQLGNVSALGKPSTGLVSGSGQVILVSGTQVPKGSSVTGSFTNPLGVAFTDESWTGTVTLYGFDNASAYMNFSPLANANSTLEFDSAEGYCQTHTTTAGKIKISKTNTVAGQYGLYINNGAGSNYITFIGDLTGDGPILMDGATPQVRLAFVGDASEWTGTATIPYTTITSNNTGSRRFSLSFQASSTEQYDVNQTITVSTNVNVTTWSAGELAVKGTGVLKVSSDTAVTVASSSETTAAGAVTFAEGAKIVVADGTTESAPATFTAALTINGDTTLTGGIVKATSATASGGSLILGDTTSELILETAADSGTVTSGVTDYAVATRTVSEDDTSTVYYLKKNVGIRIRIY